MTFTARTDFYAAWRLRRVHGRNALARTPLYIAHRISTLINAPSDPLADRAGYADGAFSNSAIAIDETHDAVIRMARANYGFLVFARTGETA